MESQQKAQMRAQQAAMAAAAPAGMVNPQGPGPMAGMQPQGAL
jgi:hypothetical protein